MKVAPPTPFEAKRLQRLRELGIMDTLPDAAFDAITELAAQMCESPIALITLVDEDRQWFKSKVGLRITHTAREFAFCAHAILMPEDVMLVEDALRDERFFDNPLVTGDPNIRFYAGAPIVTLDGHALGTVCVIDHAPRQLSKRQIGALQTMAAAVRNLINHSNAILESVSDQANRWHQQQTVMQAVGAAGIDLKAYIDKDHTYQYVNRTYLDYWGLSRDQMAGLKVEELLPKGLYESVVARQLDHALEGTEVRFETVIEFSKAGPRHVQVTYISDRKDGKGAPVGVVARIQDIEDIKEREKQLEATVELLEQKTLQQQKYFHMLSHDLKEPLNAIRNFMGLIKMECEELLPQDSLHHVDSAIQGSERMRALIDDLRRFMEIESYQMEIEEVRLNEVVDEAWLDLNAVARRQNAQLAVARLPVIQGSASLLRILFQNLFSNAIRYAREGVAPQVALSSEAEDDTLLVRVTDNGIGVPVEYHEEIFLPSRRLHSRRISPGSGLGLAMCKRIAEMHGGSITVQSTEGAGSTFLLELPGAIRPCQD
ncbi:MAG: PAS domain-containing protein [Hydrogenophaga sp.]|uniref:sensor histidine kinase n=1 Tax=Hydrogenophaga sp. TaxID=1904254 RepID=UPI0025B95DAA|nr:ATP-binding protein [Hydrogenophaga sp.]MBU7575343.1 PAS domain-containing protein [Hydrogenophaga sp.]